MKATPVHRKLCYVSKRNKLVQLIVQVQYHMNVIYSLGGKHTHILTSRTKAISRNQAQLAGEPGLKILVLLQKFSERKEAMIMQCHELKVVIDVEIPSM